MTERVVAAVGAGSKSTRSRPGDWLDAILADPTADAPRLVYADHLAARGDPRGEFIHLQCALGRTLGDEGLLAREAALLEQHGASWLVELEHLREVEWRRGFPVKGSLGVREFATSPACARVPLEAVTLHGFTPQVVAALFKARPHPTVHAFALAGGFGDQTCRALGAPLFAHAVTLDLSAGEYTSTALFDELVKATFPRLRELDLSHTPLDDAQLARLSTAKFWRRLDTLALAGTPQLGPASVTSLTSATGLRTLRLSRELDERWGVSLLKHAPRALRTVVASVETLPPSLRANLEKRFSFAA